LFAESQLDFGPLFVPYKVGETVHNLKLIFPMADLLNHPQLAEVVGVGSDSNYPGLIKMFIIRGLDF
jgi:hypothetical protein